MNDMTRKDVIRILSSASCYECAYGCKSPIECKSESCELKEATKFAINSIKVDEMYQLDYEISTKRHGYSIDAARLRQIFEQLIQEGHHNIN